MSHMFRSQEYILARIMEESSVAMIVFDKDFQIRYANRYATQLYGYTKEEFVIILVGATIANTTIIVEKLMQGIAKLAIPHKSSSVSEYLTISVGVSETYPTKEMSMISCIEKADEALYQAKEGGRNRCEFMV